jgi:ribosomal protein S27AE
MMGTGRRSCPQCGETGLSRIARYCPRCGTQVRDLEAFETPAEGPQ